MVAAIGITVAVETTMETSVGVAASEVATPAASEVATTAVWIPEIAAPAAPAV